MTEYVGNKPSGMKVEYYPDGKIKTKSFLRNGKPDGLSEAFYPNGEKKYIREYKQGVAHGIYKFFYDNGNIYQVGNTQHGIRKGYFYEYFKDTGAIFRKAYFFNYQGQEAISFAHEYDKDGRIIKELGKVNFDPEKDTIQGGKDVELVISINNPKYDSIMVVLGDYDSSFTLSDSSSLDTIYGFNNKVLIRPHLSTNDHQFLRGVVVGFGLLDIKGDTTRMGYEYYYFEKKFNLINN
jgi:hypothetical protein